MNRVEIRTNIRRLLKDTKSPYKWESSIINDLINLFQNKMVEVCDILQTLVTFSAVQYQRKYELPSDYLSVSKKWGVTFDNERINPVDVYLKDVQNSTWRKSSPSTPERYYISRDGEYLSLEPIPDTAADTTTLDGDITAAATELDLASVSGFDESEGSIIIETEVIHYGYIDSATLKDCTRGAESTTAATHSDADTITKRDIGLTYNFKADDLTSDSDIPFNSLSQYSNHHWGIVHGVVAILLGVIPERLDVALHQGSMYELVTKQLNQKEKHPSDQRKSLKIHPDWLRR